ncbi:methionine-rich copper-binding protein CopC [Microbacterium proteolyticum]|uniref:Methionine-rich copper-binding protein CopC n=1 Tax=Microbacterium proteolyticum TaxID=1572644 RepID=A0A7W5CK17_9MICO|nr:copper resistance CopC family protein [Microbacterium proteolyticum]MBB3159092.1 methionine-rich copper-binding protein CopC [Microbacterium proteolyticum]
MLRSRVIAGGIVVALAAVPASVVPASAHDQLLSSSPAAGERLPSAPDEISLSFSADVLDIGAEVVVADADGADWVGADPVISAGVVSVPLRAELPTAGYEVRWRVVSSDGHPITGIVPFTVGDAAPLERSTPPSTSATVAAPADGDAGIPRVITVSAIGAGVALAVFAVFLFLLRRRRTRDAQS